MHYGNKIGPWTVQVIVVKVSGPTNLLSAAMDFGARIIAPRTSFAFQMDSISALYQTEDTLAAWLHTFTFLVAVGVLLEVVVETFHEVREKRKPNWPVLIGGILVIIGVAGELVIEVLSNKTETRVRAEQDRARGELMKAATEAKLTAAAATRGLAHAQIETASLKREEQLLKLDAVKIRLQLERTQKESLEARSEIARANAEAQTAHLAAENERLERLRLQKSIEPRILSVAQKNRMIDILRSSPNRGHVAVECNLEDFEEVDLRDDIIDTFRKAGWDCNPTLGWLINKQATGIYLSMIEGNPDKRPFLAITTTFDAAGIKYKSVMMPYKNNGTMLKEFFYIFVGRKGFGSWLTSQPDGH